MINEFSGFDHPLGRALARAYGGLRHLDDIRKRWKPHIRPEIPTISVGNITVGGTGKTPMLIWLAEMLQRHNLQPVILSRGYLGREQGPARVTPDANPLQYGDEASMLARRGLPVWVAKQRELGVAGAQCDGDVLLLDDGFQRVEIERDFDIVMFSATGIGNGNMLPAGPLRDHIRALVRADAICGPRAGWPVVFPEIPRFEFNYGPLQLSQPVPAGQPVAALAAIAQPRLFFQAVANLPVALNHTFALPDHDPLQPRKLRDIAAVCRAKQISTLIVTEKDAIKLGRGLPGIQVVVATATFAPVDQATTDAFMQSLRGRLRV